MRLPISDQQQRRSYLSRTVF